MRTLSCILLVLFFTGCASNKANRKLKRAERLTQQAIALGAVITADTVYKEIPVFIPQVRVDSIFVSEVGDTVVIQKERLQIRYVKLPGDSIYIEGKCDSLTKIVEVPITVTKTVTSGLSVLDVVRWSLMAFIIAFILGYLVKVLRG
jgi:hypothetical protein